MGPHFSFHTPKAIGVGCLLDPSVPAFVFFEWALIAQTWSSLRQRPHHLATALAERGFQVIFVEPPSADGVDFLRILPIERGIFHVKPPLGPLSATKNWLEHLDTLLPDAPWIVHHPRWTPILRKYLSSPRTIVYDCMDDWPAFPGSEPEISLWEIELATKADLVLATAVSLYARMKAINPRTAYLSNAVYPKDFTDKLPIPVDLKHIPRPRILFVGLIGEWVDLDLIQFVAKARPDWSLVMIGPSGVPTPVLPCAQNIFWLGKKPYSELGAYMHHCDIGLIPFTQTRLTRAINPLKAHEYIASGLPVVSTFLPDLLLFDDPAIKVTSSYHGFLEALNQSLQQRLKPRGAVGIQSGSWDEKVALFLSWLNGTGTNLSDGILNRYAEALSALIEEDHSAEIAEDLALVHYIQGHYEQVLELAPAGSKLRQAALVRLGRYEEVPSEMSCAADSKALDSKRGRNLEFWPREALAAHVLYSNGELTAALEVLNGANVFEPCHHLVFGRLYAAIGLLSEAVTAFALAAESRPSLLEAEDFITLGNCCRELGFDKDAEEFYVRAYELGLESEAETKLGGLYLDRALLSAQLQPEGSPRRTLE